MSYCGVDAVLREVAGNELGEDHRLMALAGGQHKGHGQARTFGAQMDLGAEAPLAAAQDLSGRPLFLAPAACW
jgi:hypothetical protein